MSAGDKIAVVIPTTLGPVRVRGLQARPNPRGEIKHLVQGELRSSPIAAHYHDFVESPTGVIDEVIGPPGDGQVWVLTLDGKIDGSIGNSWQLGVFVAHALARHDRLAQNDDTPARVVWLTGEVNGARNEPGKEIGADNAPFLRVRQVEGIGRKIAGSLAHPDEQTWRERGVEVLRFCPQGNARDAHEAKLEHPDVSLRLVPHVNQVLYALGLPDAATMQAARGSGLNGSRPLRRWLPRVAALVALTALGGLAWQHVGKKLPFTGTVSMLHEENGSGVTVSDETTLQADERTSAQPTAGAPTAARFSIAVLRPARGSLTCRNVNIGNAAPREEPLPVTSDRPATITGASTASGTDNPLCGIRLNFEAARPVYAAFGVLLAPSGARIPLVPPQDSPQAGFVVERIGRDELLQQLRREGVAGGQFVAAISDAPIAAPLRAPFEPGEDVEIIEYSFTLQR